MIKRKFKLILVVIFLTILIIFPTKSNTKDSNHIKEELNNYKYILVNKENSLNKDFKPNNLVEIKKCSQKGYYLEEETAKSYEELCSDSTKDGLKISITSAYRSYEEQKELYNNYLLLYGKNYVDKYVAVAGHSEHQTGLAIDIESLQYKVFKNSEEYLWIKDNCYKYGFIIRYQEGKEDITGYSAEQWHIRYVGKEAAEYIYKNNITYEEYYNLFFNNNL